MYLEPGISLYVVRICDGRSLCTFDLPDLSDESSSIAFKSCAAYCDGT